MYVEVTSDDGQVYEFNGVSETNYIPNEESIGESFVRLHYIVSKSPTEHESFDAKTGESEYEDEHTDVTLSRFPEEGIKNSV